MPAPKLLAGLPKPVLFGLYGAIGGLLGALAFGELIWYLLRPPPPKPPEAPPPPEPQLAISVSKDLQLYQGSINKLFVQIARAEFDDPVTVRVEGLPPGVTTVRPEITIPAKQTEGEIELRAAFSVAAGPGVAPSKLRVVAMARPGGKSVTAEDSFALQPLEAPMAQADIVFLLDVTASMREQINGLKDGIGTFANDLYKAKVDARFACIAFRDLQVPEDDPLRWPQMKVLQFKGETFTSDATVFSDEVGKLEAVGGGDTPESSYEAITLAAKFTDYRKNAIRTLILITDAPPKIHVGQGQSTQATIDSLRDNKIDLLHLVVHPVDRNQYYEGVQQKGAIGVANDRGVTDRGKYFNFATAAKDATTFTKVLLPEMTKAITAAAESKKPESEPKIAAQPVKAEIPKETVKSLQSGEQVEAGNEGLLVLRSGIWTAAIAGLVCLFLLGGQHQYLRGTLPPITGVLIGLVGGLAVGLAGGAAGQGLFLLAKTDSKVVEVIFRVMGWALLGGLAGAGLSLFIPNLGVVPGLLGGLIGGAVGALGFIGVSAATGDLLGRLAGGLLLGLCIGMMVAVVEAAFRRAWLEVRFGPREMVTVNLGAEPVKVGSDARACTVWARGAEEVALRYFVRDGRVICTDVPSREEFPVTDGDTRTAGNVTVVVRTGSGAAPTPAAPPRRPPARAKAAPVARPVAKPADALMDLDDDSAPMPLPEPASPTVAKATPIPTATPARPAVPPPTPARPPVPTAGTRPPAPSVPTSAKPPAPPTPPAVKPAIKPATRDPDACPSCGRKNPGRPGTRYCMVCDQTY